MRVRGRRKEEGESEGEGTSTTHSTSHPVQPAHRRSMSAREEIPCPCRFDQSFHARVSSGAQDDPPSPQKRLNGRDEGGDAENRGGNLGLHGEQRGGSRAAWAGGAASVFS